jgi:mannose-1-phosphate guanylyltransferase
MKAIILAAGYGTRLRPLTNKTPKCLIPINGKPLLGNWFDLLNEQDFSEVLINTHYLAKEVDLYIEGYTKNNNTKMNIQTVYEKRLLGTAGTIWKNKKFVGSGDCVVINGDVLSNVDLRDLYRFHIENKFLLSLGYILNDNAKDCGVMELDNESKIIKFEEKPKEIFSNKIYSGIQVLNSKIFGKLPFNDIEDNNYMNLDFGYHIWPRLIGQMAAYKLDCFLIDIGTVNSYKKAERLWKN